MIGGASQLPRALDQYRLDSMTTRLALEKDAIHRDLVGERNFEHATLEKVRERADERGKVERALLDDQLLMVRQELEKERKARRTAEILAAQLKQRVEALESQREKHTHARIDAELSLRKTHESHTRVASRKRELEERFAKLLAAYRELVEAYLLLKEKYMNLKSEKALTTADKVRMSIRKVRELFTQEEADDPDRLPPLLQGSPAIADIRDASKLCSLCGAAGRGDGCAGFQCAPASLSFCVCGHERAAHERSRSKKAKQPAAPS